MLKTSISLSLASGGGSSVLVEGGAARPSFVKITSEGHLVGISISSRVAEDPFSGEASFMPCRLLELNFDVGG